MRDEKGSLKKAVVWTAVFLILYLTALVLIEGNYIFDVYQDGYIKWDF
jgi:hypothetical protein